MEAKEIESWLAQLIGFATEARGLDEAALLLDLEIAKHIVRVWEIESKAPRGSHVFAMPEITTLLSTLKARAKAAGKARKKRLDMVRKVQLAQQD